MDYDVKTCDREFLRYLTLVYARLTPVYYWQAISLWIRVKHKVPVLHSKCVLAVCFNIAVHYLGPQHVCKQVHVFKHSILFTQDELRHVHSGLLGYAASENLESWEVARSVQWYVFLNLLDGRVQ